MLTSAFFQPLMLNLVVKGGHTLNASRARITRAGQLGFTLLELLVVLTIIGLMTAVALPQFQTLADRIQFTLNRESFEQALNNLPYEAQRRRQDLIIGQSDKRDDLSVAASVALGASEAGIAEVLQFEGPVTPAVAELPLPEDWVLTASKPIIYRLTGFCSGGSLELRAGEVTYDYRLEPPRCVAELQ